MVSLSNRILLVACLMVATAACVLCAILLARPSNSGSIPEGLRHVPFPLHAPSSSSGRSSPVLAATAPIPPKGSQERATQLRHMLAPWEVPGLALQHYGRVYDGGYVVACLDTVTPHVYDALLGYGVNDDVSFEAEFALSVKRDLPVHLFDHTITRCPQPPAKHTAARSMLHWHKQGIAATRSASGDLDTLPAQISMLGLQGASNIMLKMDVEGAEWDSLSATPDAVLRQVAQIVIEFHDTWNKPLQDDQAFSLLRRLTQMFIVVHAHGNNSRLWYDREVPWALELTLVRRDLIPENLLQAARVRETALPQPGLDATNIRRRRDPLLRYWL